MKVKTVFNNSELIFMLFVHLRTFYNQYYTEVLYIYYLEKRGPFMMITIFMKFFKMCSPPRTEILYLLVSIGRRKREPNTYKGKPNFVCELILYIMYI